MLTKYYKDCVNVELKKEPHAQNIRHVIWIFLAFFKLRRRIVFCIRKKISRLKDYTKIRLASNIYKCALFCACGPLLPYCCPNKSNFV